MTIATIAANVANALQGVAVANDAASVIKFDALVTFAAGVAVRVRTEAINTGANLETDAKGRFVAVVDKSKEQRAALVAALVGAGVKDKDAANIASMGRSLSLFAVPLMIEDGSIRDAASGERMRQIIEETVLYLTNGKDTYNALEQLRGNKWVQLEQAPAPVEAATDDAPPADVDLEATLEGVSEASPEGASPVDPQQVIASEVHGAVRALSAAVERGDIALIIEQGGAVLAQALGVAIAAHREREEAERLDAEREALLAQADKVGGKGKKAA